MHGWKRAVIAMVAMSVGTSLLAVAGIPATPAGAEISQGDVLVDEAGGHVFVTYGDVVRVFDLEGTQVDTIEDQPGAIDLVLRGRTVYVLASTTSRVNAIDADTLEVTGGWSLGARTGVTALAWSNGRVWFTYNSGIGRLDPATGSVTGPLGTGGFGSGDLEATESPARLYLLDRGYSPSKIHKFDISSGTPVFVTSSPHSNACSNGRELALAPDGSKAWTACGSPYQFNEFDPAILGQPANNYQATNYPNAVDRSADGQYLVGGTDSIYGLDVWFYKVGGYVPLRSWEVGSELEVVPGMVAVANDGAHVYAVSNDGVLHTWTLAPRITSVAPAHVFEGSSAAITVTGTELGEVTAATVGGVSAPVTVLGPSSVEVVLPDEVGPGAQPVVVSNRYGSSLTGATVVVDPAKPDAPVAPTASSTQPFQAEVTWTPPAANGHPITGYLVRIYSGEAPSPDREVYAEGTSAVFSVLAEKPYRFSVSAINEVGTSDSSPRSAVVTGRGPDVGPHPTLAAFVRSVYRDLWAVEAPHWEVDRGVAKLADGSITPGQYIVTERESAGWGPLDPVVRLYRATFLRTPDAAGLDYWAAKRRKLVKLTTIADSFARSSEFVRRYGKLTDRQFVDQLYRNVLGRAGDKAGVDYWTGRLAAKAKTRGHVVASMSESREYMKAQQAEVVVAVLYIELLRRAPTASEFTGAVDALDAGGSLETLANEILHSQGYAARF